MKLQTALLEPAPDGLQHLAGLILALAVDDGIVRVPLELDVRENPSHPMVEHVVQKQVGQQRTYDSTLRRALRPLLQRAVWLGIGVFACR